MTYYEKDIITAWNDAVKIVWEYDGSNELYRQENPAAFFDDVIVPKIEKMQYPIWGDNIAGKYGYVFLTYNYERICFITNGDPLESGDWQGSTSFPCFVAYHLRPWAGKPIEIFKNDPPRSPFRFTCFSYQSGNNLYYLPVDTEKALTRDFKKYPITEQEKDVWQAVIGFGRIDKSCPRVRARFVAKYLALKGKHIYIKESYGYKIITL